MKLFKRKAYVYLVSYHYGYNIGDIEIYSNEKLDSYEKLKDTRKIIEEKLGNDNKHTVAITNLILLRRDCMF